MLPSPQQYDDWKDWASAVLLTLDEAGLSASSLEGIIDASQLPSTIPPGNLPALPAPFVPVWWDPTELALFFGNPDYEVPEPIDLFQIDTAQIADAAIETNKIALQGVTQGLIADGAVVSAKLADLAVVEAKIGNAAIVSAKIGDLQVVTAKINDLAVNTGKIGNLAVDTAKINDLAVSTAKIQLLAVNAALIANLAVGTAKIQDAAIVTAKIADAQITNALIADATILSAKIAAAQIISALIGTAVIQTGHIADAQITTAKIGAAQITNALIADATITSAKIASLVVNKITAGTLDAVIDVGTGAFKFTIGGNILMIGRGFGSANQFIMWFGPNVAVSSMTEANATFYLKTNGNAYFGGALSAGVLYNSRRSTAISSTADVETGTFGSNGNPRLYTASVVYNRQSLVNAGGSYSGTAAASITIEKWNGSSWVTMAGPSSVGGSYTTGAQGNGDIVNVDIGGSISMTDNSGGLTVQNLRARLVSRTMPSFSGSFSSHLSETQTITITSSES